MDLAVDLSLPFSVVVKDHKGNVIPGFAGITVSVSDPSLASVSFDGQAGVLSPVGPVGTLTLMAVGAGLQSNLIVNLLPGSPATIEILPGTPA